MRIRTLTRKKVMYLSVIAGAAVLVILGGVYAINRFAAFERHVAYTGSILAPSETATGASSQHNNANQDIEQPPASVLARYQAPADHPKYIIIPKLHINTRVLEVGLTSNRAIETPSTGYDTAWYSGSALPGASGATFIDGHVDGLEQPGVFHYLKTLVAGDTITLVLGDNTQKTYKVQSVQTYDVSKIDMNQVLASASASLSGLNLMTCTGTLLNGTTFSQRLVVYSTLQR